jgi:uncharacterized protein (DUF3084 family)
MHTRRKVGTEWECWFSIVHKCKKAAAVVVARAMYMQRFDTAHLNKGATIQPSAVTCRNLQAETDRTWPGRLI